jgi:hypothetical protein
MSRILWFIRLRPPFYSILYVEHFQWRPQGRPCSYLAFSPAAGLPRKTRDQSVPLGGLLGNTASPGQRLQKTMAV